MTNDHPPAEVWQDPIVAEVRKAREALFAEANYDIHEFCRRLSARQASSGHSIVKRGSAPREDSLEEAAQPPTEAKAG